MRQKAFFKLVIIVTICLGLTVMVFAGTTGKISGNISDAETGEHLPGVNVFLQGTSLGGATDLEGDYFVINVPPGTYTLAASMMGYGTIRKTDVRVMVDRTVTVDFALSPTVLEGEEVTIVAEREIVAMDVSASQINAEAEEIVTVPFVTEVRDFLNLQAGVENNMVRGGGLDQTGFMVDGLMMVDNRVAQPMQTVNLSSVKEVNIIKGGFNAEYGNIRSGLINIITKEGKTKKYHGSIDLRITPPRLKHSGYSIMDPRNYEHRAYLDPAVCWEGTENGSWSEEEQARNKRFMGWNAWAASKLSDNDPNNDLTPEQYRDMYLWTHAMEGSEDLQPPNYEALTGRKTHENVYGNLPDWLGDVSFSGPVPFIGKSLGDLSFFASYRKNNEAFAFPKNRKFFKEDNAFLKLTSRISPNFKLTLEGMYGETETNAAMARGTGESPDEGFYHSADESYLGYEEEWTDDDVQFLWWPDAWVNVDIYKSMVGIAIDHTLSPTTFYNVRINQIHTKNYAPGPENWRDRDTIIRYFGPMGMDEKPWGFEAKQTDKKSVDGAFYSSEGGEYRDWSENRTTTFKFDLNSQIHKNHLVKTGLFVNYDDIRNYHALEHLTFPVNNQEDKWSATPVRAGLYLQDKFEFEGMIANIGLRGDYTDAMTDWYDVDRYSKYFSAAYKTQLETDAETKRSESHFYVSPRLGISHPISDRSKLYFNYGHFYSMLTANDLYRIGRGIPIAGIDFLGNPSAEPARTIAYELGFEYNLMDQVLIHMSGYYKDVANQSGTVTYENYDASVSYGTTENNYYADIRGFEVRIDKRFGRYFTGWINYNYMVTTSGYLGRETYYQDPRLQRLEGYQNPYQERPIAQPFARTNLRFMTPQDYGPVFWGMKPLAGWAASLLYTYRAGEHFTWDPLNTYKLVDNVQWKDYHNFDARISLDLNLNEVNIIFFADIQNLFNIKHLSRYAGDFRYYMRSLKLPMYNGTEGASKEAYEAAGLIAGDDKPGDIKGDGKDYIYMPLREYLWYFDERFVNFGIKFEF
ncbi:TonB-dependent receptor [candidate division KSB1 bacterium]|nr:TonB-dependent receptor [candidate division KSB1 bacterium]